LTGMEDGITSLAFSPDNRWLSAGSYDGGARLWNLETIPSQNCFRYSGDAKVIAVSMSGKWMVTGNVLWMLENGKPTGNPIYVGGSDDFPTTLAVFSPAEKWLITATYQWNDPFDLDKPAYFSVYDLANTNPQTGPSAFRLNHVEPAQTILFSPNDRWLALSGSQSPLQVWDLVRMSCDPCFTEQVNNIVGMEFNEKENMLLVLFNEGLDSGMIRLALRVWSLPSNGSKEFSGLKSTQTIAGAPIKISPGGRWLVTLENTKGWLWDMDTLQSENGVKSYVIGTGVTSVYFSQNQNILCYRATSEATSEQDDLYVADLVQIQSTRTLAAIRIDWQPVIGSDGQLRLPILSKNGKWLITDAGSCKWVSLFGDMDGTMSLFQSSPRGKGSAILFRGGGGGGGVGSYNIDYRAKLGLMQDLLEGIQTGFVEMRGHEAEIDYALISPDEQFAVTLDDTQALRLWKLGSLLEDPNQDPVLLPKLEAKITLIGFSPDSQWFIVSTDDGFVRLWETDILKAIPRAETLAGRNFIIDEWHRYFPGKEYRKTIQRLSEHPSVLQYNNQNQT
jgi:WD40 repeat protein